MPSAVHVWWGRLCSQISESTNFVLELQGQFHSMVILFMESKVQLCSLTSVSVMSNCNNYVRKKWLLNLCVICLRALWILYVNPCRGKRRGWGSLLSRCVREAVVSARPGLSAPHWNVSPCPRYKHVFPRPKLVRGNPQTQWKRLRLRVSLIKPSKRP